MSVGEDATLRVWNLASGRCEHAIDGHTSPVRAVALTSDGRRAVSASEDATLRVWDVRNGCEITSWVCDPWAMPTICRFVPTDTTLVVYGDARGGVHVLRLHEPNG